MCHKHSCMKLRHVYQVRARREEGGSLPSASVTWQAWQAQQHIDIFAIHSARQGASASATTTRRRQRQRRRQRRRRGPNMCECLCRRVNFRCWRVASDLSSPSLPTPVAIRLLFRIPHSSVRSPFSVLLLNSTFATQYGKCHLFLMAFWHLPLLNMFACSPLRSLSPPSSSSFCFSVALPQTTLMYFQFCGFSFAFLFHFLFAFSFSSSLTWRGDFCAGVAAKLPKSCSALAPVEVFFTFSLTNSVLVVFSVAFDKPITFILIWLLYFRMCFMPETSWNVSCISSRFNVALKAKLYLRTFSNMLIESQFQLITKLSVNEHN